MNDDRGQTDRFSDWDAAYVLGALSPTERREFEDHLHGCAHCAAAVAELAGVPGLLATIPADQVSDMLPAEGPGRDPALRLPDTMLPRLLHLAAVRTRRRRRSRIVLAAASAIAVAAAIVFGVAASRDRSPAQPAPIPLNQVVAGPMHASVRLVPESWGTRVDLICSYDRWSASPGSGGWRASASPAEPAGRGYSMTLTGRDGRSELAATWTASPGTTAEPSASTWLAVPAIARVQVLDEDGRVLLELDR